MSQTTSITKTRHEQVLDTIDEVTQISSNLGIAQLQIEDEELSGRTIRVKGRDVVNFGSCSYLNLEKHPAIIQGVVDAVTKYGSQFSSSRAYASVTLYSEAENLLEEIFERPVLLACEDSLEIIKVEVGISARGIEVALFSGAEIVDADDRVPVRQQSIDQRRSDEARRAGDHCSHPGHISNAGAAAGDLRVQDPAARRVAGCTAISVNPPRRLHS